MMPETTSRFVDVDGLRLHYLEVGQGDPVLLLHGWPTSSFLWRRVIPPIAAGHRAIALDLPGFGRSDKPLDVSYSFRFFDRVLSGFVAALSIEKVSLAVHDLGGPIGLYWGSRNTERLDKLIVLNTLVYPEVSWAVALFVASIKLPVMRSIMASPWGLRQALRIGVAQTRRLADDALDGIQEPFQTSADRKALLAAGCNLSPKGMVEIAGWLPTLQVPVRGIYGARDRILPDIAKTMGRLQADVPHAEITSLDDCGHFLQEERPDEIGRMMAEFLGRP
ncbi:MAG: alpha/beta fold hydrolase [Acidobacteriota bacterium]